MWGLVILGSLVQSALALQVFLETPGYSEVNPGATVVLPCFVREKGGECRWEKDGNPVGIFEDKYEWAGNLDEGNCSLAILDASSEYDDGVWQCQVTASNFKEGDSLISEGAEVVVRAAPKMVELKGAVQGVVEGVDGQQLDVECVAKGGNPAPSLSFLLGGKAVISTVEQRNIRLENGGWESRLALPITLSKEQQESQLVCQAHHQVLSDPMLAIATLDISYAPLKAIIASNGSIVQEGNSVLLSCKVGAHPVAAVFWEHDGRVVGRGPTLLLPTVTREDAGEYQCRGENRLGRGEAGSSSIEVMYAPVEVRLEQEWIELALGVEGTVLGCQAKGVPEPTFRWLRGTDRREVGRGATLRLGAVGYGHGGSYFCEATNSLGRAESKAMTVEVKGSPRVSEEGDLVRVGEGERLEIEVRFCANPLPTLAWHSAEGGLLEVLADSPRRSLVVEQEEEGHCYLALLNVDSARAEDTGRYMLQLENQHGAASHLVDVEVLEAGLTREILIAIVAGSLLTLCILIFILATQCRCRTSRSESKTDVESIGTSTGSQNTQNEKIDNSLEDLVFNESYESYRQPDLIPPKTGGRTPSPAVAAPPSYNELCFPRSSNCGSMRKARPVSNYSELVGGVYSGPQQLLEQINNSSIKLHQHELDHINSINCSSVNVHHQRDLEHINTMSYSNYVGHDSLYHWRRSIDNEMYA